MTTHLVIGLPKAGKTTYLAALWQTLESGEVSESLRLGSMAEHDQTYLNRIRDAWLRCQPLQRTTMGDEQAAIVPFIDELGQAQILTFPDLSGETFENQWVARQWTFEFAKLVHECEGCLLFINPEHVREASSINDAYHANPEASDGNDPAKPWEPTGSPTQVIIVDLLQSLVRSRSSVGPLRLAIVMSAWDVVKGENLQPEDWLRLRLPLLHQYLFANAEDIHRAAFGVSAQGGPLTEKIRLLQVETPSKRITVVCRGTTTSDVTLPVRWLLCGDVTL